MFDIAFEEGWTWDIVTAPPHYPTGKLKSQYPVHQAGACQDLLGGSKVWRSHFREHGSSIVSRIVDQAVISVTSLPIALKASKERKPDIVMATAPPLPTIFCARLLSWRHKVPFIVDLRDAWPELVDYLPRNSESNREATVPPLLRPLLKLTSVGLSLTLGSADGIIATNQHHADYLATRYNVPTAHVSNLPLVNTDEHDPTFVLDTPTEEQPRTSPHLHVLYSGTVGRAQGLENTIHAVHLANKEGANVQLRIVGSGACLPSVKALASKLGVDVQFIGQISRQDLGEHYKWSDTVLVHLKGWRPLDLSVPSKVFEAIASTRYVTGVIHGEAARIINESGSGKSIEPGNARALADHFVHLAHHREELHANEHGRAWIEEELVRQNPGGTFINFLKGRLRHG